MAGTEIFQVCSVLATTQNRSFWLTLFPELRIWIRRGDRGHEVVYVANWRVSFNCRNIHTVLSLLPYAHYSRINITAVCAVFAVQA